MLERRGEMMRLGCTSLVPEPCPSRPPGGPPGGRAKGDVARGGGAARGESALPPFPWVRGSAAAVGQVRREQVALIHARAEEAAEARASELVAAGGAAAEARIEEVKREAEAEREAALQRERERLQRLHLDEMASLRKQLGAGGGAAGAGVAGGGAAGGGLEEAAGSGQGGRGGEGSEARGEFGAGEPGEALFGSRLQRAAHGPVRSAAERLDPRIDPTGDPTVGARADRARAASGRQRRAQRGGARPRSRGELELAI